MWGTSKKEHRDSVGRKRLTMSARPREQVESEWRQSFSTMPRKAVSSVILSPRESRDYIVAPASLNFYKIDSEQDSKDIRRVASDIDLQFGITSIQGQRETQEDSHLAKKKQTEEKEDEEIIPFSFFGVYDGHGGQAAAVYVAENLFRIILNKSKKSDNYIDIIRESFAEVEEQFLKKAEEESLCDGTTACIALIKEKKMFVANVGDSELVLCRDGKPHVLTEVHNPKRNSSEAARVESEGGVVINGRVGHPRLNPRIFSIAVSRALGDIFFKGKEFTNEKNSGLTAIPFVKEIDLKKEDQFIVLACDGVWDVMSYEEAVEFILYHMKKGEKPEKITDYLVAKALEKGSTDNITALIVTFGQK